MSRTRKRPKPKPKRKRPVREKPLRIRNDPEDAMLFEGMKDAQPK